ncbi:MAG: hypothetical protein AAF433_00305 [Bacteroidota bacterium]
MSDINPEELKNVLRAEMRQRLKAELSSKEAKASIRRRLRPLSWAATVLLAALALWFFWPTAAPDGPALFAEHFKPLPNALSPTIRGQEDQVPLDQALMFYDGGNYAEALQQFSDIPEAELPPGGLMYRGLSYLGVKDWNNAIKDLARAEAGPYQLSASWYRALAILAKGDIDEARNRLKTIRDETEHPFREQAEELLSKME